MFLVTSGTGAVLDDVGFVASSCPQDLTPINDHHITEIALRVYEPV